MAYITLKHSRDGALKTAEKNEGDIQFAAEHAVKTLKRKRPNRPIEDSFSHSAETETSCGTTGESIELFQMGNKTAKFVNKRISFLASSKRNAFLYIAIVTPFRIISLCLIINFLHQNILPAGSALGLTLVFNQLEDFVLSPNRTRPHNVNFFPRNLFCEAQ